MGTIILSMGKDTISSRKNDLRNDRSRRYYAKMLGGQIYLKVDNIRKITLSLFF